MPKLSQDNADHLQIVFMRRAWHECEYIKPQNAWHITGSLGCSFACLIVQLFGKRNEWVKAKRCMAMRLVDAFVDTAAASLVVVRRGTTLCSVAMTVAAAAIVALVVVVVIVVVVVVVAAAECRIQAAR